MPRDLTSEGMTGIEPALSVWKTEALPLSYIPERSTNCSTPLTKNQIHVTDAHFRRSDRTPPTTSATLPWSHTHQPHPNLHSDIFGL